MKSNKKLIIVSVIIALIAIIVSIVIMLFFATDIFKSDKEMFLKYLVKNEEILSFFEVKEKQVGKYLTEGEITFDLSSKNEEIANQQIPARNFKISYIIKEDKELDRTYNESTLKYLNKDLFTLKYLRNANIYALKSDEVINKYMSFENNNLKAYAQKIGLQSDNIPDKVEINLDELLYIEENEKKEITNKYMEVLNNTIPKSSYIKQKNVNITINGTTIKTNIYKLVLNAEQIFNLKKSLLETLLQDEKTLNIILSKIKSIDTNSQITIEDLKNSIQEVLNNLQQDSNQFIEINVYESNKELIKTEYIDENGKITIDFERTSNAKKILITNEYKKEMNNISTNFTLKTIEMAQQKNDTTNNTIIIITLNTDDNKNIKISSQMKNTNSNETINKENIINVNIAEETFFNINLKENTNKVNFVEIEELNSNNSVKINDWPLEYTEQIFNAIGTRLKQLFDQKKEMIMQNDISNITVN